MQECTYIFIFVILYEKIQDSVDSIREMVVRIIAMIH